MCMKRECGENRCDVELQYLSHQPAPSIVEGGGGGSGSCRLILVPWESNGPMGGRPSIALEDLYACATRHNTREDSLELCCSFKIRNTSHGWKLEHPASPVWLNRGEVKGPGSPAARGPCLADARLADARPPARFPRAPWYLFLAYFHPLSVKLSA